MGVSRSHIKVCGAILAGGTAGRIGGISKGLIETDGGRSIIEVLAGEMKTAGVEEVVLSAIDVSPYEGLCFEIVTDLGERMGPIGGIEAVLEHFSGRCDGVLLMPCDVPNISAKEIGALIDRFVADGASVVMASSNEGRYHPLCAVVRDGMGKVVSESIKAGQRKVMNVWFDNNASIVDFDDESVFHNINTHDDLSKWSKKKGT